jgi:sec-independent protein translocase protein TatA
MLRGLFQPMHLLIILGIVLIIFGPGKLPGLGTSIGKAFKGFRKAVGESENETGNSTKIEGK